MPLSDREKRLLAGRSHEAVVFREGADCEARIRREDQGAHRGLVDCLEALVQAHPDWTSGEIALSLARIFNYMIEEDPI